MPVMNLSYMGREDVFAWMGGNLIGEERPHSLILTGQPKMGKTSTLLQLVNGVLGQALREFPEHTLIPVYLNVDELDVQNTGALFAQMSQISRPPPAKLGYRCAGPCFVAD